MARNTKATVGKKQAERAARKEAAERKKRIRLGAAIGVAVIGLVALLIFSWPEPDVGSTEAEAWSLPALEGEGQYALADFAGKPTVAAFFASWCTVCESEIPGFKELSESIGEEVNFVGINSQDNGRGLGDAEKWGIAGLWPLARDIGGHNGSGLATQTFAARGMPLTVIYSPEGTVAHVQRGGMSAGQLNTLLTNLFGV